MISATSNVLAALSRIKRFVRPAYLRMPWPPSPRRSGVKRRNIAFVVALPPGK